MKVYICLTIFQFLRSFFARRIPASMLASFLVTFGALLGSLGALLGAIWGQKGHLRSDQERSDEVKVRLGQVGSDRSRKEDPPSEAWGGRG